MFPERGVTDRRARRIDGRRLTTGTRDVDKARMGETVAL